MAHARRYFVRALRADPTLAQGAIDPIAELYRIDGELAELGDEDRSRERKRRMMLPLKRLRSWLAIIEAKALPKSPLGRASDDACTFVAEPFYLRTPQKGVAPGDFTGEIKDQTAPDLPLDLGANTKNHGFSPHQQFVMDCG